MIENISKETIWERTKGRDALSHSKNMQGVQGSWNEWGFLSGYKENKKFLSMTMHMKVSLNSALFI